MIKQFVLIFVVLVSMGLVSAGEIVKQDHGTVFIYGQVEDTVFMSGLRDEKWDYNKTVCINATVIEGEIDIVSSDNYYLEYIFIADLTDDDYISRSVILNQTVLSTSWITGIKLERTCSIDGMVIGNYETTHHRLIAMKHNTFYWNLIDNNVRFGDEVVDNVSLAFTQLNYLDQQDFIPDQAVIANPKASHKYISVGKDDEGFKLAGLTGWAYNAVGKVPWGYGKSTQAFFYMPLMIVQYTFNFLFTFLFMIINNWWYSLLLLEIFCIIPALTHKDYPSAVGTFIDMHVKIFYFMYHKVILPLIAQLLRLIEIIRNLFRI